MVVYRSVACVKRRIHELQLDGLHKRVGGQNLLEVLVGLVDDGLGRRQPLVLLGIRLSHNQCDIIIQPFKFKGIA